MSGYDSNSGAQDSLLGRRNYEEDQMNASGSLSSEMTYKKQKFIDSPVSEWEIEMKLRSDGTTMASLIDAFSNNLDLAESFFPEHVSYLTFNHDDNVDLQINSNSLVESFKSSKGQDKTNSFFLIRDAIAHFVSDRVNLSNIQELVVFSTTSEKEIYMLVLAKVLSVIQNSPIMPSVLPYGLAVILSNIPDNAEIPNMSTIFADILTKILTLLPRSGADTNDSELFPLLRVLIVLLDAMVYREISVIDRVDVYNPLREVLVELEGHTNPTISVLSIYAQQGLENVCHEMTKGESFVRQVRLVLSLIGNCKEIVPGSIPKLDETYNQLKQFCNSKATWYQQLLFLDCIMGKQDWLQVEDFILHHLAKPSSKSKTGFLQGTCIRLEHIAATQPIELRKGAIKMLIHIRNNMNQEVKDVAHDILVRLGEDGNLDRLGNTSQSTASTSLDKLYGYKANHDMLPPNWDPYWRSTSKSSLMQTEMRRREQSRLLQEIYANTHQSSDLTQRTYNTTRHLSNQIQDLQAYVQNQLQEQQHQFSLHRQEVNQQISVRQYQNGKLIGSHQSEYTFTNQPALFNQVGFSRSSEVDRFYQGVDFNAYIKLLQDELYKVYKPQFKLESISQEPTKIQLDTCNIELEILSAPHQRFHDHEILDTHKFTAQNGLPRTRGPDPISEKPKILVSDLFAPMKIDQGFQPLNKILIQGRAGIGKTTLCKKIVHSHLEKGMWKDKFKAVFWLPLRELRTYKSRCIQDLLREKYFPHSTHRDRLVQIFPFLVERGDVLFVLDGLDEIVTDIQVEEHKPLNEFLRFLLSQKHLIITARPSGVNMSILEDKMDAEVETVGFNSVNVEEYVNEFFSENQQVARNILDFINGNKYMQTLVNVPIQLEVVCYGWSDLSISHNEAAKKSRPGTLTTPPVITVTILYSTMVYKLLRKDMVLLDKARVDDSRGGKPIKLIPKQIERLRPYQIDPIMETEITYLSYLSFNGLSDGYVIEFNDKKLCDITQYLDERRAIFNIEFLPFDIVEQLKRTSFLHSADTAMIQRRDIFKDAWHFLHLTFQEFFAAKWIARHFRAQKTASNSNKMIDLTPEETTNFIKTHRFNAKYEIVWSMLAGLLADDLNGVLHLNEFFDMLEKKDIKANDQDRMRILKGCLSEARHKLDDVRIKRLEVEIKRLEPPKEE